MYVHCACRLLLLCGIKSARRRGRRRGFEQLVEHPAAKLAGCFAPGATALPVAFGEGKAGRRAATTEDAAEVDVLTHGRRRPPGRWHGSPGRLGHMLLSAPEMFVCQLASAAAVVIV